jgi:NAD(P)-dependent dehydrogenase (short-subunit alcohol dehydrogenase family)
MSRALVLGGTGLVGRAIALRLARAGWRVDVTGRDAANLPRDDDPFFAPLLDYTAEDCFLEVAR